MELSLRGNNHRPEAADLNLESTALRMEAQ